MAKFICSKCKREIIYSRTDKTFERMGWTCPACWTIISDRLYPAGNIAMFTAIGDRTLGSALGDRTVFEVVKRNYIKDNPDETVIFLSPDDDHVAAVSQYRPDKIFLTEFYREDTVGFDTLSNCYRINVLNDVCEYARRGDYPRLEYPLEWPDMPLPEQYVVLHIRRIEKAPTCPHPQRNVPIELAKKIIDFVLKFSQIIIIGNDDIEDEFGKLHGVHDLRWKLTLPEIAGIMSRSLLYVGRDSGLIHVAAAAGAKVVGWNFNGTKWFPKTDKHKYIAMTEKETTEEGIFNAIGRMK